MQSLDDYLVCVGGINGSKKSDNNKKTRFGCICDEVSMGERKSGGNFGTPGSNVFSDKGRNGTHHKVQFVKPCRNARGI